MLPSGDEDEISNSYDNRVLNMTQNNQYVYNTSGEVLPYAAKCGQDLSSDRYTYIPSENRGNIHRNLIFQIDHHRLVQSKANSKESMLMFDMRIVAGYLLTKKRYFYVKYPYYKDTCYCEELCEKCECEMYEKNTDVIEPEDVDDYTAGLNYRISMIAPTRFRKSMSSIFGGYNGNLCYILSSLCDRQYKRNTIIPMHTTNCIDLARDFRGSESFANAFKDYTQVVNSKGVLMKYLKDVLCNSIINIRNMWTTFLRNGQVKTVIHNGVELSSNTKFDEQQYLQAWQFDRQISKRPIVEFIEKHCQTSKEPSEITFELRKYLNNGVKRKSQNQSNAKDKKKSKIIDEKENIDDSSESEGEKNE